MVEWFTRMKNKLKELEEKPETQIHTKFLKTILKKATNWKPPDHDVIIGFWFNKFIAIYDRLTQQRRKCQQVTKVPE